MRDRWGWYSFGLPCLALGASLVAGCGGDNPARDAGTIDMSAAEAKAKERDAGLPSPAGNFGERGSNGASRKKP